MLKVLVGAAVAAFLAAAALASQPAHAMAIPAPAGLNGAIDSIDLTDKVQCRAVWRCGYWGCGWRRVCFGAPYGLYRPYGFYRPYGYRPYGFYRPYRPYWGNRGYRRW